MGALGKLLSSCPVLEEFTIHGYTWQNGKFCRNVTLTKLTIMYRDSCTFSDMILDTPNLAYLEYSGLVPQDYPFVNLDSLVEAKLDLRLSFRSNATNLIKGLRNVKFLELSSAYTSEVFSYFGKVIPVLSNLFRLSITVDPTFYDWGVLPVLLHHSPNLHTLVIKGPVHAITRVSSCPVKILKIKEYGGKTEELDQMKRFLKTMSCLELVKVRAYAVDDQEKSQITKNLLMVPRSSKCNIQTKFCDKTK